MFAIGCERRRQDAGRVPLQALQFLSVVSVPQPGRLVLAARQHFPPIRGKGHVIDRRRVALETAHLGGLATHLESDGRASNLEFGDLGANGAGSPRRPPIQPDHQAKGQDDKSTGEPAARTYVQPPFFRFRDPFRACVSIAVASLP